LPAGREIEDFAFEGFEKLENTAFPDTLQNNWSKKTKPHENTEKDRNDHVATCSRNYV